MLGARVTFFLRARVARVHGAWIMLGARVARVRRAWIALGAWITCFFRARIMSGTVGERWNRAHDEKKCGYKGGE